MSGQGTASAGGLFERLSRYVDALRGSDLDVVDYRPDEHPRLVAFEGLAGYQEVDRYWLNAPFAFASINYDDEEKHHLPRGRTVAHAA